MMDDKGRVWITQSVRPNDVPRLVSRRVGPSLRRVLPDSTSRRVQTAVLLRARHREVRAHRHLLFHPPSAVRRRRERHVVAERVDRGDRLAEHEAVRRDRRRAGGAGLVPDGHRHQRRRCDHEAVDRADPGGATSRSTRRGTRGSAASTSTSVPTALSRTPTGRSGSHAGSRYRDSSSGSSSATTRRRPASRRSTSRPTTRPAIPARGGTVRVASTSTATASSGPRSAVAGTLPASTGASAGC